tara:strand:+ start:125 stop:637 length:513 start_codon:yes stop_codon:yes gene_type:complete
MKKKGNLIWIEGFSGSGKTQIAKKIQSKLSGLYGPTILINGDDTRKIFKLNDYSKNGRLEVFKKNLNLTKLIINQNVNVIFTVVGLNKTYSQLLKKNFKKLVTILIKTNVNQLKRLKLKKTYKNKKNVVGLDIVPDFPKYDIILHNNFKKSLNVLAILLANKIKSKLTHK